MLDENLSFALLAPAADSQKSIWFNVMVPDIRKTYDQSIKAGCTEMQPVTDIPDYGVTNAVFADSFGYVWILHQGVSHEQRLKLWGERREH